jgi:3-oxoacyl-[acyl-carrier protein] reductase
MFREIRRVGKGLDIVINNAGVASMNHTILTPLSTVTKLMQTNFNGTFLV